MNRKTKSKIVERLIGTSIAALLLAILIAGVMMFYPVIEWEYANAANDKCPDGKTCYIAVHKQTGDEMCRHNANKPWQWYRDANGNRKRCGQKATKTPRPKPTKTSVPPTAIPKNDPVDTTEPWPDSHSAVVTPTCTYIPDQQPMDCPYCEIFGEMRDALQTQAAAQSTWVAP